MQTISVHSSDAETNLQNIAAVLQEHAVPKYFDEVQYVTEGENKGVQCYINGAIRLIIDIDIGSTNNYVHYYFATWSEQSGFLSVATNNVTQSSRFTVIDIFDDFLVISANGTLSTTTNQNKRSKSVIIGKSTTNNTCTIFRRTSGILQDLTSGDNTSAGSGMYIFNLGTFYQDFHYPWDKSTVQSTNLTNFMCSDGSVVKGLYWAILRSGSDDEGVHPVLINGEQYYGLLYNQIITKS